MSKRVPRPEWAAIDVRIFRDPKILELNAQEKLALIASILWTVEELTDGRIPRGALGLIGVTQAQARTFVRVGLWLPIGEGWQIAAWDKWQKPREDWQKLFEHRSYAGKLANCQRWHEEWCRCLEGEISIKKAREAPNVTDIRKGQK